jgi:hypothetical protein
MMDLYSRHLIKLLAELHYVMLAFLALFGELRYFQDVSLMGGSPLHRRRWPELHCRDSTH